MNIKYAQTDYPIQELLKKRWSPRAFADKPVDKQAVMSLLEAARWTPSSYNEQPWRFLIVSQDDHDKHGKLVATLSENNKQWAAKAPLLIVGLAKLDLTKTGAPNRFAVYDTGQAVANMVLQAMDMGLYSHQMGGYDRYRLREQFNIPEQYEVLSVTAIGYPGEAVQLPEPLRSREGAARSRKPLSDIVFNESREETLQSLESETFVN